MTIRTLIVDDHVMVRSGMVTLLGTHHDMEVVGQASSGEEALRFCATAEADVAIVDLMMPHMSGVETIATLRTLRPSLRCVALTSFTDRDLIVRALNAGAVSVLFKDISGDDLAETIRRVYAGQTPLPQAVVRLLARSTSDHAIAASLSAREQEVLQLIVGGMSNGEIAYKLKVRPSTVKTYITRIFSKLNVNSRAQATAVAVRQGLAQ